MRVTAVPVAEKIHRLSLHGEEGEREGEGEREREGGRQRWRGRGREGEGGREAEVEGGREGSEGVSERVSQ